MTVADIARAVFEHALEYVVARARKEVPAYVTREDFERAIIELRLEGMDAATHLLDVQRLEHERAMRELRERFEAERAAGNVPEVTIIEPTGDEPTTRPFKRDK